MGLLYDKIGFKIIFYFAMVVSIVISIFCYIARTHDIWFFFCIQLSFMVFASIFSLFPAPVSQTFGPKYGTQVYALVLANTSITSAINCVFIKVLFDRIGNQNIFYIGTALSVLAILINLTFDEKLDVERLRKKGRIEGN